MIAFMNGDTITYQQAADWIRAEPEGLIVGKLIDIDGHRCAGGVLLGSTCFNTWPRSVAHESSRQWTNMVQANNTFKGTQEERAEFMAKWFEAQV